MPEKATVASGGAAQTDPYMTWATAKRDFTDGVKILYCKKRVKSGTMRSDFTGAWGG